MDHPHHVYEAQEQLAKPEFVAEVLKETCNLEEDLDFALSLYFCGPGRHFTFMGIVSSHIQFSAKIKMLEDIPARKSLKSRVQAITGLRRFQRIRNIVAHTILARPSKVRNLCDDETIRGMVLQYPQKMEEEFRRVRNSLYHLTRSREWKPDLKAKKPDQGDKYFNIAYRITYG
jgi:hypothetical protein